MRELLSLARQLRPTALDDLGLAAAIAGQVDRIGGRGSRRSCGRRATSPTSATTSSWSSTESPRRRSRTPPATRGAKRIEVALRRDGKDVELEVADDGRGFAFDESERGLGIAGMRERALLIGGELTIESRPEQGTTVRLRI